MVSKSSREIAGKMHKLEEQSSTKGTTVSQGESHTEPLTRQGPEQRTGRALPSVLYSNTAEAHPFSFRRKTLAPRYKTMRGASPVPAGLLVDPGDMSQGECGTLVTCHRGSVAPARCIMLKLALMLLRCLCRMQAHTPAP